MYSHAICTNKKTKTIASNHLSIDDDWFSSKIFLKRLYLTKERDNLTKESDHYVLNNNLHKKLIIAAFDMLT